MISAKLFPYLRQISLLSVSTKSVHVIPPGKKKEFEEFCNVWRAKYTDLLAEHQNIQKETWEDMRKYIMGSRLTPSFDDSIVLELFRTQNCPDAGISYYRFLENNNYNVSITAVHKYLQLYDLKDDSLSESEKVHISSLCKNIMDKYSSYDMYTSNILVKSLCRIHKWEEAIKIIDIFEKNDNTLLRVGYSSLISYFFVNKKEDLGYKYLVLSFKKGSGPVDSAYSAYLKYCMKDKDTFSAKVEKLFNLWNQYGIKPSKGIVCEYLTACNQFGWSASLSTLLSSICSECKQTLSEGKLTDKEYNYLKAVTQKKLISENMYYVTNPEEFRNFKNYVDRKKPFDVIIDGLNFVHCAKHGYFSLRKTLKIFKKEGKKVLVIGRKHMIKKLRNTHFTDLGHYYFVENISKDDAFLLYAAFSSGRDTIVISQDLMRNHKFAMQDMEVDALFKKWQTAQQYNVADNVNGIEKLNAVVPIDAIVQKQNNCWHIPYVESENVSRKRHLSNSDWACFNMCPQKY